MLRADLAAQRRGPQAWATSQSRAATPQEPRTETCPSSGRSHSSASGQRAASQAPCALGTIRSCPPWKTRTGTVTCPGSNPHGADVAQPVVDVAVRALYYDVGFHPFTRDLPHVKPDGAPPSG